jgi:S-adenosylmethionine hydrolase
VKLAWPSLGRHGAGIAGQIVYIDRFGNAVTNVENHLIGSVLSRFRVQVANHPVPIAIGECYQSVASGQPVALLGSHGCLEIALNGASAAAQLSLRVGDSVQVIEPA